MSGLCGHHETVTGESQTRSSDDVSSAERGKQLCNHVYLFHEPEGQPELEIVFIHGLHKLGDSFENAYFTTWLVKNGHPANCWPMTWLVDKFPTARILSISYDSSLFRTATSGNMDLHQLGQTLIKEMVTFSGIGQKGCPVVFVCHSLGGLIAKKIVVMAGMEFKEDKKVSKLLTNTKAFFFYATPHRGSELVSQMARKNPSPLADNLKTKCNEIARLNSDFEDIRKKVLSKRLEFYTVAETHDTKFHYNSLKRFVTGMVVTEHSVRFGSEHIVFVATDHFDVCKPKTESDSIFLHLIECISKVLDEHKRDRLKILKLPVLVVGVDEKLSVLMRKLKDMKDNNIVGLVGMGGIGKTTLSKSMFHSEQGHYAKSCFLENAKDKSILELQKELFKELCGGTWNDNEGNCRNLDAVQQTIKNYKVLVVIDDPGTKKYLEDLQVPAFEESSSGSKVVITCRRRDLLSNFNMSEEQMVEVDGLNDDQAWKLFSHYAFHGFNDHHEINGEDRIRFEEQAKLIVQACGFPLSQHRNHHLPLSLEVVGQHLRKQNRHPADDRMEMWKGALDKLKAARAVGGHTNDEKLWKTLRVSFDDLEDWEKSAFLDFACILCDTGDIYASSCRRALEANVLQNLIDSSLIKVANGSWKLPAPTNWWSRQRDRSSESTTLWEEICETSYSGLGDIGEVLIMHNQLRDMGRRIVADSDKMTRIWKDHDVQEFVEKNKGLETLEGLSLGQSGSSLTRAIISQGIQKYTKLPKLRLLKFSNTTRGIVEYFMKSCSLTPSGLIWLRLSYMIGRPCLDTLGAFTGLKVLHISRFLDDQRIEIGGLTSLLELRIEWNTYRGSLPTTIGTLRKLEMLVMQDGFLRKLPVSIGDWGNLVELHLLRCRGLKSLPSELHGLTRLKVLNLTGCNELETIPSLGQLTNLERILLGWCTSLLTLEFGTRMVHLHELILEFCMNLESLNSLSNLDRLRTLDLGDCRVLCIPNLPECFSHLSQLQNLNLKNCKELAEIPTDGHLCTAQLVVLHLSAVPEAGLPRCTRLKLLNLYNVQDAWDFKENLQVSDMFSCGSLENVMQNLQVLSLTGFDVHKSLGMLMELQELYVDRVPELPDSLGTLKKLKILRIRGILSERLPEQIGELSSLRTLAIEDCHALVELPSSLDRLPQLRTLEVENCSRLGPLPESLHLLVTREFVQNYSRMGDYYFYRSFF